MKKVVVLGGGTGLSVLLRGLKLFPVDITAVVTVADDGASSGILRKEFNIPAVGDLRNVLVSLSNVEPLVEQLLQYRFKTSSDLNNHALGNLMLTALYNITGDLTDSLEALSKILNLKGKVLPFTEDKAILVAHTKDKQVIEGESNITKAGKKIDYVEYKKDVKVTKEVLKSLEEADLIILGIGSLYTSIIPNLLSKDMKKALTKSKAKKMYVCNLFTQPGETDDFKVSDHIKVINKYINKIDVVIANNKNIPYKTRQKYAREEEKDMVKIDKKEIEKLNTNLISDKLYVFSKEDGTIKHDSLKTSYLIFSYLMDEV